ncbi:MAG: glycosyltransferase family 2 protein [Xanthomonadales bacterium]|nr:glycosyltransferase family 2 protein [Gammaproteobacteria bacterium]MBT8052613.1 glycosyltransferase family 2 protein [Gammaproteobacteria bacterium]NND56628.1 glycosyltransferase family 2 protein [Xanthomonadales bacterium]NNK52430.1 glycosyltransferase family 2 protein [Xanthomonadales bacterium]
MTGAAEKISVVIPAYNAAEELACCLESVFATTPMSTEVLIIDDASPDPATQRVLDDWREKAPAGWTFTRHEQNLGFVATANRGMRATHGDVVLLNSDTLVTPRWLEGLQRCLASGSEIATATPWTNNGEIASIPLFCESNPVPPDVDAVAAAIAQAGSRGYPELPTAVGFCMAVSRRAIERVGVFNAEQFGKGYGEENDFSLRAAAAGMRNVLCDDVYVAHLGGRSFGPAGLKPDESSMQRLLALHPGYLQLVQSFIETDPLFARRTLVLEALERAGVSMG